MRVLVDYRPALRERSGVGEYIHQLVKALMAAFPRDSPDARLDLTLFSSSWKDRLEIAGTELAGVGAIDRRVPVGVLNYAWHRFGWPPADLLAGRAFDLTHSPHPLILPSRGAAHVVTIADLNFLAHPERTRAEIRRDYPVLARSHAHRADHIIVISRFTAAEVERRLGVDPNKISVCVPGAPEWTPRAEGPSDGYVLFFGTLEPRKNVGALLDAYETLAAKRERVPRLVLAGQTTAESRPWLERLARPPLARVARHIGYVPPEKRQSLYEGAAILVQPSFEEGFGMTVLEAMTVGVPVVAANRGALPEVVGDAGPLVDAEAPEEMTSAIERILDDPAFAAACSSKGALRSRQFRWEETARRVYDAYRLAVERRAARGDA